MNGYESLYATATKALNSQIEINGQLQAENKKQRRKGYEEGLRAFAWWKDGIQYVGTCGKTLEQALKDKP